MRDLTNIESSNLYIRTSLNSGTL